MATTTIRPASYEVIDATVADPENGFDGDTGTFCEIKESVSLETAELRLSGWPQSTDVSDGGRTSVTLKIRGDWTSADANHRFQVWFSSDAGVSWDKMSEQAPTAFWDDTEKSFTITTEAGENPEQDWLVSLITWIGDGVASPPSSPG